MDTATDGGRPQPEGTEGAEAGGRSPAARLLKLALALELVAVVAVVAVGVADRARIRFDLLVIGGAVGVALLTLAWPLATLSCLRVRHRLAGGLALGRALVAIPVVCAVLATAPFLVLGFRVSLRTEPGFVVALTVAFLGALAAEILYAIGGIRVWKVAGAASHRKEEQK